MAQIAKGLRRVFDTLPDIDASGRRALASNRILEDTEAMCRATPVGHTVAAWRWDKLGVCSYAVVTATTAFAAKNALSASGFDKISLASILVTIVTAQFFPPVIMQASRALGSVWRLLCCCSSQKRGKTVVCVAVPRTLADLVNRRSSKISVDPLPIAVTADPFVCFVSMMWMNTLRDVSSVLEVEQWRLDLWAEIVAESGGCAPLEAIGPLKKKE